MYSERGRYVINIGDCGSTLYVGLYIYMDNPTLFARMSINKRTTMLHSAAYLRSTVIVTSSIVLCLGGRTGQLRTTRDVASPGAREECGGQAAGQDTPTWRGHDLQHSNHTTHPPTTT